MNFVAYYYLSFRPSTVIKSHAFKLNHLQDLKLWYLCHASSSSKGSAGILLLSSLLRFEHKKCPLELELVGAELLKIFNQPVNTAKKMVRLNIWNNIMMCSIKNKKDAIQKQWLSKNVVNHTSRNKRFMFYNESKKIFSKFEI